jgi:hypothetical protein
MVIGVGISLEPFNFDSSAAFGDLVLCCIVGQFPLLVASSCTTIHALHIYRLFTFVISALSMGRSYISCDGLLALGIQIIYIFETL